jgi:ribosomal protein L5
VYLDQPSWTEEDERRTQEGRALFGIHDQTVISRASFDEFPRPAGPNVSTHDSRTAAHKRKARRKEARKSRKRNR